MRGSTSESLGRSTLCRAQSHVDCSRVLNAARVAALQMGRGGQDVMSKAVLEVAEVKIMAWLARGEGEGDGDVEGEGEGDVQIQVRLMRYEMRRNGRVAEVFTMLIYPASLACLHPRLWSLAAGAINSCLVSPFEVCTASSTPSSYYPIPLSKNII